MAFFLHFIVALYIYAATMFEAKEQAKKELGDYLKTINEIVNCSFARELVRSQAVD